MIPNNYNNNNQYSDVISIQDPEERIRQIDLHLQLLNHAISCQGCQSRNCGRMKEFLDHHIQHLSPNECRTCRRAQRIMELFEQSKQMDIN